VGFNVGFLNFILGAFNIFDGKFEVFIFFSIFIIKINFALF
jgi:hypothetical protein